MLAIGILPQSVFAVFIGNGSTGRRAYAYCNNQQVLTACFFCQFCRGVNRIFTIAENDQRIGTFRG